MTTVSYYCTRCHEHTHSNSHAHIHTHKRFASSSSLLFLFFLACHGFGSHTHTHTRYGSDSCSDSDDDDDCKEGIAAFDTDVVAGDASVGCPEGRLSTFQASRLLVLMAHARTCPGRHAKAQHADVCRSTKFLMLHMRDCTG